MRSLGQSSVRPTARRCSVFLNVGLSANFQGDQQFQELDELQSEVLFPAVFWESLGRLMQQPHVVVEWRHLVHEFVHVLLGEEKQLQGNAPGEKYIKHMHGIMLTLQ